MTIGKDEVESSLYVAEGDAYNDVEGRDSRNVQMGKDMPHNAGAIRQ